MCSSTVQRFLYSSLSAEGPALGPWLKASAQQGGIKSLRALRIECTLKSSYHSCDPDHCNNNLCLKEQKIPKQYFHVFVCVLGCFINELQENLENKWVAEAPWCQQNTLPASSKQPPNFTSISSYFWFFNILYLLLFFNTEKQCLG